MVNIGSMSCLFKPSVTYGTLFALRSSVVKLSLFRCAPAVEVTHLKLTFVERKHTDSKKVFIFFIFCSHSDHVQYIWGGGGSFPKAFALNLYIF